METPLPITDDAVFESLCDQLAQTDAIALDTEFERRHTFFARLALIQVHDGTDSGLIDPLSLTSLTPFGDLLRDYSGTVVMHAPLEDLEILQRSLATAPAHLFDTQLAAALVGLGAGLGYDRLVLQLFDITISKAATRSNWLRRPLTQTQLEYAINDTLHLLPAMHILLERLEKLGRREWLCEEVHELRKRLATTEASRDYARLAKRVEDDGFARGRLCALLNWREHLARTRDVPRRRLLDDAAVVNWARHAPSDVQQLDIPPAAAHIAHQQATRGELEQALAMVAQAPPLPRPAEAEDLRPLKRHLKAMKSALVPVCEQLSLPSEVVAPNRLLEQLAVAHVIRDEPLPKPFMGWRREAVLPALLEALDQT